MLKMEILGSQITFIKYAQNRNIGKPNNGLLGHFKTTIRKQPQLPLNDIHEHK